jgi:hypothetical protein
MTLLILVGAVAPGGAIGVWTPSGHFGHSHVGRYGDSLAGKIDHPNAGQSKVLAPA